MEALHEKLKPEMLDKLMSSARINVRLFKWTNDTTQIGVSNDIIRHKIIKAMVVNRRSVLAEQINLETEKIGKMADDWQSYSSDIIKERRKKKLP